MVHFTVYIPIPLIGGLPQPLVRTNYLSRNSINKTNSDPDVALCVEGGHCVTCFTVVSRPIMCIVDLHTLTHLFAVPPKSHPPTHAHRWHVCRLYGI